MNNTIYSIFNDVFSKNESNIAIYTKDGKYLTFGEVRNRAAKLASLLEKEKIEKGSLVAICMQRDSDYLIAICACILFGYGFVPMDSEYPKERVEMIVEDSKADFIINNNVFDQSEDEEPINSWDYVPEKESTAYVVFTSGSTGRPKGIVHDQLSLGLCVKRVNSCFKLKKTDTWGVSAPFTFVALTIEALSTLAAGASVRVIPREIVRDPELQASYIASNSITATFISPRSLRLFKPVGNSLRLVITGGEKVSNITPHGYRIVAGYGQSETCGPCIFCDIENSTDETPVGHAYEGCALYLADENGRSTDEGEICIAGHFMSGYMNLEKETKKVIERNPFKQIDGYETWIRTGDLGKKNKDGEIVFVNRKDWMIKINGQRVEPGEIETKIKAYRGIKDAAVKSFVNRYGQTYICAYYTADEKADDEELRTFLQGKLPLYMVPSFFIQLEAFPLNQNRKLDRTALQEPDASSFLEQYQEPSNEMEALLCRAFEKTLGLTRVGINDNFFRLGGDSIKAMMVVNECPSLKLSVRHVYSGRTPKGIEELKNRSEDPVYMDTNTEEAPLSDSQMGVFLDIDFDQPGIKYNIPFVLRYSCEQVNLEDLKNALIKTFTLHQAFSLTVKMKHGLPFMCKTNKLPEVEVAECCESEIEEIKKRFVKPFCFDGNPLCRSKIVKTDLFIYLFVDISHLLFDGTSLGVFRDTLNCFIEGRIPTQETITPMMVGSSDHVHKGGQTEKDCINYFKNLLYGCEVNSNLIPDVCNPDEEKNSGTIETTITNGSDSIEFFTKTKGVSENILFASAYALALAKYTGQKDSLFASVESGRPYVGMERSVGMFVKTFPVYIPVDENQKTLDYLQLVQKNFYEAMSHDEASFVDVVHECQIDASVKFVYQAELLNNVSIIPVSEAISNMDMMVIKQNGCYKISVSYRKSMYSDALITNFIQSFCSIVNGLIQCSNLCEIKLVSNEQIQLLDSFNRTEKYYDEMESVVDVLKKQVAKYPEKTAVSFKDTKLTYSQFDELTDNIAAYLISAGVKENDNVPVLTGRSHNMAVLVWGVIKAGAVCQPLDPAYPAERLSFMIKDSSAKLLISDKQYSEISSHFDGQVLYSEDVGKLPKADHPFKKISPENGLALLYTSGTTGLPKGFILSHRNLRAFVFSHVLTMNMDEQTRFASYAGFGFDACLMDIISIPMTGGSLCIIPEEIRLDLKALCDYYIDNKITHGFVTTQLGCLFAQKIDSLYLKYFMVGGEKLIPFNPSEKFKVINGYGPSECIAYVTHFEVKDGGSIQPIGTPSYNTKLYVTDAYGRRLPIGACGELLIAGHQISNGYINRPEITEKAFVENKFCNAPGYQRVYKTGDIVRYLPDGNIEYIGRRDSQVKVRGYRVELTEIEKIIRSFGGIKNTSVQAFDDPSGGKYIAAYITSDNDIDIEKLNRFISSEKPEYMVPAITMQIDSIPYTPNGKVDKRKLPLPEYKAEEIIPPTSETQRKILDLIVSITGNKNIGITSNIFNAGLTSLGVIRLNATLSETFDIAVQTKTIKDNPTVEKLEQFICSTEKEEKTETVVYQDFPLTKTQEGIFIECQGDLNSTVYNIPSLLKISKEIDINRLKIAICEAVEAHSYINTTLFFDAEGNVRQKVAPIGSFGVSNIEVIQTKSLNDVKESLVKAFKLVGSRLFRICIIEAEELYLFMDFHHIICDGTSMQIFVNDIEVSYKGQSPKSEKYSGFDVALYEQKSRNSHVFLDAEEYYQNLLSGIDTEFLPHSDMHSYAKKGCGKIEYSGHDNVTEKVDLFCNKNRVSENSVLCTAFGYVLAAYNGTESSVFTTVYNGRNDSRLGNTVSMLVKTLPVVFNPENLNVNASISKMSDQLMNSMANDIYSFAEISEASGIMVGP